MILDFLDHLSVLLVGQVYLSGVHLENTAPFVAAFVLGNQVHMQMTAGITVGTVIDFVGVEGFVKGGCCLADICHEQVTLLLTDVDDLADVILVSYDHAAGLGLLLEQNELAHPQITDGDTKACQNLAAGTVAAVGVFHNTFLPEK